MIISASRRTDIPAFFTEWFFKRLKKGFVYVRNPINKNHISKVSLLSDNVDCFVFWTKNPKPFLERLSDLSKYKYYFHFTLNSYDQDIEPELPKKQRLIDTFIELSKEIGKEKVIWRYDPILFSEKYTIEHHIKHFESIAKSIHKSTEKCVISFIDVYKKCERNLKSAAGRELSTEEMIIISEKLKSITEKYGLSLDTCAENVELASFGIGHNRCIDNVLIERILRKRVNVIKDKNQRDQCGCIESIDIGSYNTCKHGCLYCYANSNQQIVKENLIKHSVYSPLLFGEVGERDKIVERKMTQIVGSFDENGHKT